jgi:hypothetical protein
MLLAKPDAIAHIASPWISPTPTSACACLRFVFSIA